LSQLDECSTVSDARHEGPAPTAVFANNPAVPLVGAPSESSIASTPSHAGYPAAGETWGKFLIEKTLAAGGQGEVFQAFDQLGPAGHVALKVPRKPVPIERIQQWLDSEVAPLVKLDHPNIVRVLDAGCVGEVPYVATQLVQGLPLNAHVKANPPSPKQILDWMIQLADALHHAHSQGIVHRDLKPQNVVITPAGKPLVIDFGVAQLVTAYQPEPETDISGTFAFMAPEQARGDPDADHRVDVFGLGGILKFLLQGEGPYGRGTAFLAKAREGRVELLSCGAFRGLRRALCRVANRALAPDPPGRYRSADDLARALRRIRSRRALLACAAGLLGLAAAIVALCVALGRPSGPHEPRADLQVLFQRANDVGSHRILRPFCVPLRTGDRIQIHAKLTEPLVVYLVAASSSGTLQVLYPPQGKGAQPTREVHVPPGPDDWLPLEPPPCTETLILLARREPLKDVEALLQQLRSAGSPPVLGDPGLLVAGEQGVEFLSTAAERPVGAKEVRAERGFLVELLRQVPGEWTLIRAVAFPHEPAAK